MEGFLLLCAHLVGDYIFQGDRIAKHKATWATPYPRPLPPDPLKSLAAYHGGVEQIPVRTWTEYDAEIEAFRDARDRRPQQFRLWRVGVAACTVHCLLYALSVFAFTCWWAPWWVAVAAGVVHWPIDRFALAKKWMIHVSGQEAFATGPLSPWSVIVVDNIVHLLTLVPLVLLAGYLGQLGKAVP